jgi:hypothetical protein
MDGFARSPNRRKTTNPGADSDPAESLGRLRAELADLAFTCEYRGLIGAADVANAVSARIGEIRDELISRRELTSG